MDDTLSREKTLYLVKRLLRNYLKPYMRSFLIALGLMAVAAAMTAGIAKLMEHVVDDVLAGDAPDTVVPVAAMVFAVFILRGLSTYGHTLMMNTIGQSIIADIQKEQFAKFMNLDLAFFHDVSTGELISRVTNDVSVMRTAITDSMTGLGKSTLTLLFLVAVMFYQDAGLALACFVIFPIAAGVVAWIGRRLRKLSGQLQDSIGGLSGMLSEIFQGIRQVKSYGMERYEIERSAVAIDKVKNINIKAARIGNMSTPVNEIMVGIVLFAIIIYGGYAIADGELTAGQLTSFLTAFIMAYEPMKKLSKLNNVLQTGLGATMRVFDILDTQPDIVDAPDAITLHAQSPVVAFEQAQFAYKDTDEKALHGISFEAKPGHVTALVGPSGGGKSTMINLITRFYDVTDGAITIDGHDIRTLTLSSLRGAIALVSQDITIFDDTVAANIRYGRQDASDADVQAAAQAAAAHDFISDFPEGYDTRVGEDGVKLSGGQRQRISIARAILKNAPILLLDEATSALDNESEKAVQGALKQLEKGRTTIVIAHRLSTIQGADQILVLDKGQIAEKGKHAALLKKDGLYAQMHKAGL